MHISGDAVLKKGQDYLKPAYTPIPYLFIFDHIVYIGVFIYEMQLLMLALIPKDNQKR